MTCADGGIYIDHIDWSQWNSNGAQGIGTYNVNDCDSNCAEGTFHHTRVKVHLSRLATYDGKYFLRTLVIRTFNGENLLHGSASSYEWDVMEFAETIG